jgi:hypothetical protein
MKKRFAPQMGFFFYDYNTFFTISLPPRFAFCTSIGCTSVEGIVPVFLVPCTFVLSVRWLLYRNV